MENNICTLGIPADGGRAEFLRDFSWDCNWYWGGGYIGNNSIHHHFKGLADGENVDLHTAFNNYFARTQLTDNQVWRLCDLMKQFYAYKEAAECFRLGGHMCSSNERNKEEINNDLAKTINLHIQDVIIPEVRKLLKDVNAKQEWRDTKK